MPNTYSWKINSLSCDSAEHSNVVVFAEWIVEGSNGVNIVLTRGIQPLAYNKDSVFIPYKNLAELTVIQWVQNAMGQHRISQVQKTLDDLLTAAPSIANQPLPWVK
jgi:hypothetical protein